MWMNERDWWAGLVVIAFAIAAIGFGLGALLT